MLQDVIVEPAPVFGSQLAASPGVPRQSGTRATVVAPRSASAASSRTIASGSSPSAAASDSMTISRPSTCRSGWVAVLSQKQRQRRSP
jgi:hypothetical protein